MNSERNWRRNRYFRATARFSYRFGTMLGSNTEAPPGLHTRSASCQGSDFTQVALIPLRWGFAVSCPGDLCGMNAKCRPHFQKKDQNQESVSSVLHICLLQVQKCLYYCQRALNKHRFAAVPPSLPTVAASQADSSRTRG